MPSRLSKSVLAALGLPQLVAGHTLFTNFFVDGVDQGNATCVRMPITPNNATFPINNLLGDEMACGYNGERGVARVCSANAGSTLTFEWRAIPDNSAAESIDISHKGPCAVYLKQVDSAIHDEGVGDGWFKIWDDGYDETAGKWCTEKLRDNNGHFSIQLPSGLAGGYYLVRPELLALHQADKTPSNPQFYVGCAQLFLNSTGTGKPSSTVSIPNYVQPMSPPVHFDIWTTPLALPYPMPGPDVANITSGSTSDATTTGGQVQTEGLQPPSCVLAAANWCGIELAPYTSVEGCYNASSACWAQAKTCYSTAPPTGDFGCRIWETKCDGIQAQFKDAGGNNNAQLQGPPGYMKDLTPPASTLSPSPLPSPTTLSAGNVESADENPAKLSASASAVWASISGGTVAPAATMSSSAAASLSSSPSTGTLTVSQDGACGGSTGQTCQGSKMGKCCSAHEYCGSSDEYCGSGCQAGFGSCGDGAERKLKLARMMKKHGRYTRGHF